MPSASKIVEGDKRAMVPAEMTEDMEIGNLVTMLATIPILKYICESNKISLAGTTKAEIAHAVLEFIGNDKERENKVRETIVHLK